MTTPIIFKIINTFNSKLVYDIEGIYFKNITESPEKSERIIFVFFIMKVFSELFGSYSDTAVTQWY